MIVLNIELDNIFLFKNFSANFTYPKKIVGSTIEDEYLKGHPNFRYKKINIIMGANASGKTSLGKAIMNIFNFLDKKNYMHIVDSIDDKTKPMNFSIDLAGNEDVMYRVKCSLPVVADEEFSSELVNLSVQKVPINKSDSYESCVAKLEKLPKEEPLNYVEELEKLEKIYWKFEYPAESGLWLKWKEQDKCFGNILSLILRTLDPAIKEVTKSNDVDDAYVIRFEKKSVIIQNESYLESDILSSGTKEGIVVASLISAIKNGKNLFYYCDEKFSYVHSEVEKAILSVMINSIQENQQLFFTTHNTDILEMNLPKHTFSFLRKDIYSDVQIRMLYANDYLKRSSDSLKKAVENDLFCTQPSYDLVYDIENL